MPDVQLSTPSKEDSPGSARGGGRSGRSNVALVLDKVDRAFGLRTGSSSGHQRLSWLVDTVEAVVAASTEGATAVISDAPVQLVKVHSRPLSLHRPFLLSFLSFLPSFLPSFLSYLLFVCFFLQV